MFRKVVSVVAAFALAAGVVCPAFFDGQRGTKSALTAAADEETPASGFCGAEGNEENVTWNFDESTGTLTISGTGDMEDGDDDTRSRWSKFTMNSVIVENGVTSIGDYTFYGCKALTSVTIPDSVISIGFKAFDNCINLASVTIPDSVTEIGGYAFNYTPWWAARLKESPFVTVNHIVIASNQETCTGDIIIPDDVTQIGACAFASRYGLTSVTIPDSVTSIGKDAFWSCDRLTSVTIPDSVTAIGDYAFADCEDLAVITILNPDCKIAVGAISNGRVPNLYDDEYTDYYHGVIRGYEGSTAQTYAETYGYTFESLGETPAPAETTTTSTTTTSTTTTTTMTTTTTSDPSETTRTSTTETTTATPEETTTALPTESTTTTTSTETTTTTAEQTTTTLSTESTATSTDTTTQTTPSETMAFGDMDNSGNITIDDATMTLQVYTNQMLHVDAGVTDDVMKAMDLDEDGAVTIDDATYILAYYTAESVTRTPMTWYEITGNPNAPGAPE